jgi:hypothetical protein
MISTIFGKENSVDLAQEKSPVLPAANGVASATPIDNGTADLLAKHGALPGAPKVETRGRHKKDCRCGQCVGSKAAVLGDVPAPRKTLSPAVVKKAVSTAAKGADKIIQKRFYRRGLEVLGQGPTNQIISDTELLPEEVDLWSDLAADLAAEMELDGRYAPVVLLVASLGAYSARWKKAFDRLNEIEEKNSEKTEIPEKK